MKLSIYLTAFIIYLILIHEAGITNRGRLFSHGITHTKITVPYSSYNIPASVSTIRTAQDAPMATTIRLFFANASISAAINPITADSSISVAVSIAGNVMAAKVANGT